MLFLCNLYSLFIIPIHQLFKPEGSSLGFSVVGLKSQDKGELGIFVQEIQPYGVAARYVLFALSYARNHARVSFV